MSDEKKTSGDPIKKSDANLAKKFGHIERDDFKEQKESEKESKKEEKIIFFDEKETDKEVSKESSGAEKDSAYNKILSKIKKKKTDNDDAGTVISDAKVVSEKTDAESQIKHLVDLATTKDVVYAAKVAKHLEDNYVLDMFHDKLLSDEFHDALVKEGLIE